MYRFLVVLFILCGWCGATAFADTPSKPELEYRIYSESAIELFWNRSSSVPLVVAYEISRNGEILDTLDALSFFDDQLMPDEHYSYSVIAINAHGNRSEAATVQLSTDNQTANSELVTCAVVRFPDGVRLSGLEGRVNVSPPVLVSVPDGVYEITLGYEDSTHSNAGTHSQPDEQWVLESLNNAGKVTFVTSATADLPDSKVYATTNVGEYDTTGIVALRARHAKPGKNPNSIVPTHVILKRQTCSPGEDVPDIHKPTSVPGLEVVDATDSTISVSWHAAADNVGVTAYILKVNSVFADAIIIEENTDLTYTFTGLQPATDYLLGIVARDAAGNFSESITTVNARTSGNSVGGITLTPNPLEPFQCRGSNAPTREFGVLNGFSPNEPVLIELNGRLISSRPADSNGSRSLRWRCATGGTISFVATGAISKKTFSFQLETIANNFEITNTPEPEDCTTEAIAPLEIPVQARVINTGIFTPYPLYVSPSAQINCREPTNDELRPGQAITIVAISENYVQLSQPSGWLRRIHIDDDSNEPITGSDTESESDLPSGLQPLQRWSIDAEVIALIWRALAGQVQFGIELVQLADPSVFSGPLAGPLYDVTFRVATGVGGSISLDQIGIPVGGVLSAFGGGGLAFTIRFTPTELAWLNENGFPFIPANEGILDGVDPADVAEINGILIGEVVGVTFELNNLELSLGNLDLEGLPSSDRIQNLLDFEGDSVGVDGSLSREIEIRRNLTGTDWEIVLRNVVRGGYEVLTDDGAPGGTTGNIIDIVNLIDQNTLSLSARRLIATLELILPFEDVQSSGIPTEIKKRIRDESITGQVTQSGLDIPFAEIIGFDQALQVFSATDGEINASIFETHSDILGNEISKSVVRSQGIFRRGESDLVVASASIQTTYEGFSFASAPSADRGEVFNVNCKSEWDSCQLDQMCKKVQHWNSRTPVTRRRVHSDLRAAGDAEATRWRNNNPPGRLDSEYASDCARTSGNAVQADHKLDLLWGGMEQGPFWYLDSSVNGSSGAQGASRTKPGDVVAKFITAPACGC